MWKPIIYLLYTIKIIILNYSNDLSAIYIANDIQLQPNNFQRISDIGPFTIECPFVVPSAMEALYRSKERPSGILQMRHFRELSEIDRNELRQSDLHARHYRQSERSAYSFHQSKELWPSDSTGRFN